MRCVVDQAHFADVVARVQYGKDTSRPRESAVSTRARPLSRMNKRVRLAAMFDDELSTPVALLHNAVGDPLSLSLVSKEKSGTRRIRSRLDNIVIGRSSVT